MSTHNEQKIVFPENSLESFVYVTEQINRKYLEGSCEDEVINNTFFDHVRFDKDIDGIRRRKLLEEKKDLIKSDEDLFFQVFLLGHGLHADNYEKNGPFNIDEDPDINLKKFNSSKPKLTKGQWATTPMKRNQKTSGVANWLFTYGPKYVKLAINMFDGKKSFKELLDDSAEIMGWRDNFHLTRTFKELSIIRPDLVNNTGEVYEGTYSKFALNKGFNGGFTQTSLLCSHSSLQEILELPYNVEHNLCNWIKWLMHKQNIKTTK